MDELDLWVTGFEPGADPVPGLMRVFRLDEYEARSIVRRIPCIVKNAVRPTQIDPWVEALEGIGAQVQLRAPNDPPPPPSVFPPPQPSSEDLLGLGIVAAPGVPHVSKAPPRRESVDLDADFGMDADLPVRSKRPRQRPGAAAKKSAAAPAPPAPPAPAPAPAPPQPARARAVGQAHGEISLPDVPPPPRVPHDAGSFPAALPPAAEALPLPDAGFDVESMSLDLPPAREERLAPSATASATDSLEYGDLLESDLPPAIGGPTGEGPSRGAYTDDELQLAEALVPKAAPRRLVRREREPLPAAGPRAGGAGSGAPGVVVDRRKEKASRTAALLPGIGLIVVGLIPLAVLLFRGRSCFLGTASMFSLAGDGVGFAALGLGLLIVGTVMLFGPEGSLMSARPGAAALVLGYAAAFGVNYFQKPNPDQLAARLAELDEDEVARIFRLKGTPEYPEARFFLQGEGSRAHQAAAMLEFVDSLYAAGARSVHVVEPTRFLGQVAIDELAIEMPGPTLLRNRVVERYRTFIGHRATQLEPAALTPQPGRPLWIVWVATD